MKKIVQIIAIIIAVLSLAIIEHHSTDESYNTSHLILLLGTIIFIFSGITTFLTVNYQPYTKPELTEEDKNKFSNLPNKINSNAILSLCLIVLCPLNLIWAIKTLFQYIRAIEINKKFPNFYDNSLNNKIKNGIIMSIISIILSLIAFSIALLFLLSHKKL